MTEYMFVDGAYLRERLDRISQKYFEGERLEMDYQRFFMHHEKVFYFDCSPPKRKEETEKEHQARLDDAEATFRILRALPGCHVILGQTKNQRQKGVDVQLAVQALTHVFRHNTRRLTILTGDLDFKPLVEALVLEGAYVTLAFEPKTTAIELRDAADAQRALWTHVVFENTTSAFKRKHGLPSVGTNATDDAAKWLPVPQDWKKIWEGKCSTGRIVLYDIQNPDTHARTLVCRSPEQQQGYSYWLMHSPNEKLLMKLADDL
jgi:uncharacterized LabA/DUF88 family protein